MPEDVPLKLYDMAKKTLAMQIGLDTTYCRSAFENVKDSTHDVYLKLQYLLPSEVLKGRKTKKDCYDDDLLRLKSLWEKGHYTRDEIGENVGRLCRRYVHRNV